MNLASGVPAAAPSFTFYSAAASSNTIAGGSTTRAVNSITVVGNIGNGGTLTINGVDGGTTGGTKTLSLDYINGDVAFTNTDCSNCRNAFISVNGGSAVQVQMPISAQVNPLSLSLLSSGDLRIHHTHQQSWDILYSGYLVSLSGFQPGQTNTIQISNPNAYTPDFYQIGVSI